MTLMVYGAYGYTGELVAREAMRRGLDPVLAGRSISKLKPLADELGLQCRAFPLESASANLAGIRTVLNCAGPFSDTAAPMTEACISHGVHYVDVTGEIPVFQHCHAMDARAQAAGVILCPGAGFDVVPTDCLAAALKARKPDAVALNLAFSFGTKPSLGTIKTTIEGMAQGGMVRRNHALVSVPDGYDLRRIPFPQGERWAATVPYGDVYTAGVTTGIPDITVYSAAPYLAGKAMKMANPLRGILRRPGVQLRLKGLAERFAKGGPGETARTQERTEFWGEAIGADGGRVSLGFTAPNVYALTADTALAIAAYCSEQDGTVGYFTPSLLMGPDFIGGRSGVTAMV